jgi:UDP-N-acetylmuramoyl-tripeptide--D-alanyl-D-alanine ligase
MVLTLGEIREALRASSQSNGLSNGQPSDALVTGYSIDSRTLQVGDLFFAIHGERFDGHAFVAEVLANGATAVVIARSMLCSGWRAMSARSGMALWSA